MSLIVGACATSTTAAPATSDAGTATASPSALASASASPSTSVGPSGSGSAEPSGGTSSSPGASGDASASITASPAPSIFPPPPAGAAHVFACHSLISDAQVSSLSHIRSTLFLAPPGVAAKIPKGETECKWLGAKTVKSSFDVLTTDVYVLTGPARATFDATWKQYRGSSSVVTVDGIGDDAAWEAAQFTLIGFKGTTAFDITLEPSPLTLYTPAQAQAIATAMAKIVVSHL